MANSTRKTGRRTGKLRVSRARKAPVSAPAMDNALPSPEALLTPPGFHFRIKVNFEELDNLEPHLDWALQVGLLSDEEVVDLVMEALVATATVEVLKEPK